MRLRRPRITIALALGVAVVMAGLAQRSIFVPWFPWLLPALTMTLALFVLPEASTFDDPGEFRVGVLMIAGAIASFWAVQNWIARLELGFREFNIALHAVALFFSVCLFGGGIFYLSSAAGSRTGGAPACPECSSRNVRVTLSTPEGRYLCCEKCEHLWIASKRSRTNS